MYLAEKLGIETNDLSCFEKRNPLGLMLRAVTHLQDRSPADLCGLFG